MVHHTVATELEQAARGAAVAVGLIAVLLGLFAPRTLLTVPGWAYMLLPVLMPLYAFVRITINIRLVIDHAQRNAVSPKRSRRR